MTNSFTRGLKRLFLSDFRLKKKYQKMSKIKKTEINSLNTKLGNIKKSIIRKNSTNKKITNKRK